MRKECIFVMLGIIIVSTISSFLARYAKIQSDKVLLDTVVGAVGAGNFSYWQLGHTGPLLVELTTLFGDADLYVSDSIRPTYDVNQNNFSSVTCGHDLVKIPTDFPRPIGIGVFGHWSHHLSEYSIQVFLDSYSVAIEEQFLALERSHRHLGERSDSDNPDDKKSNEGKKPQYLKFLNILDMIFEMFVL